MFFTPKMAVFGAFSCCLELLIDLRMEAASNSETSVKLYQIATTQNAVILLVAALRISNVSIFALFCDRIVFESYNFALVTKYFVSNFTPT
jgi:hypothetical protein